MYSHIHIHVHHICAFIYIYTLVLFCCLAAINGHATPNWGRKLQHHFQSVMILVYICALSNCLYFWTICCTLNMGRPHAAGFCLSLLHLHVCFLSLSRLKVLKHTSHTASLHIHTNTHTHYTHKYMYTHITCTCTYKHTYTHIHVHVHMYMYTHTHTHTYAFNLITLLPFIQVSIVKPHQIHQNWLRVFLRLFGS